ncbi:MAG: oxidoreductase [Proteobacteria bacterium SG_bin5]|nr:SDR family NAD(P)-dependent oxidoreductase [Sphingomonas sp.]OQW41415.1 MAG: oxidoreductase [Proteobacteria bacterium SG_bin5]
MAEKLAIVTGASSGIGLELARCAAEDGYDLIIAANEPMNEALAELSREGVEVTPVVCDLATFEGVDELLAACGDRVPDMVCANAGNAMGGAFLDVDVGDWTYAVNTNITGTLYLLQNVLRPMVKRQRGQVLVTGSIAGYIPGPFNAVYNATKAFIDNFSDALRNELKDSGVTLTLLMPGATDTEFFKRADMEDTGLAKGATADPADVARDGWKAALSGRDRIVSGLFNKAQVAAAGVTPPSVMAEVHRHMAQPKE